MEGCREGEIEGSIDGLIDTEGLCVGTRDGSAELVGSTEDEGIIDISSDG